MQYRRIRELREDSDRTQAQVAAALGLSQRAYSYYETGTRMIPPWGLAGLLRDERGLSAGADGRARALPRAGVAGRARAFFAVSTHARRGGRIDRW